MATPQEASNKTITVIFIIILIILMVGGTVFFCYQRRIKRRRDNIAKWQSPAPTNDYSYLADAMEPTATSDPFGDVSFENSKQRSNFRSSHNNI